MKSEGTPLEQAEFEQGCRDAEEDDYDDEREVCDDCGRENCRCDTVNNCTCGAWKWGNTGVLHVADCICGAE